jgi:hypothetical protein
MIRCPLCERRKLQVDGDVYSCSTCSISGSAVSFEVIADLASSRSSAGEARLRVGAKHLAAELADKATAADRDAVKSWGDFDNRREESLRERARAFRYAVERLEQLTTARPKASDE